MLDQLGLVGALRQLAEVRDDGVGLPEGYRAGTGLQSMRGRATELGGDADAIRNPSRGTTIRAWLPLPRPI